MRVNNRLLVRLAVFGLASAALLLPCPSADAGKKRAKTQAVAPVLVVPFAAVEASRVEWLSPGIAAFVAQVARESGLQAIGPAEALRRLSAQGLPASPERLVREPLDVARELGASHVVSGDWAADGTSGIVVQASTFAIAEDRTLQRVRADGALTDLSSVLADVVLQLMSGEARERAEPVVARLRSTSFTELAAWMRSSADPASAGGPLSSVSGQ